METCTSHVTALFFVWSPDMRCDCCRPVRDRPPLLPPPVPPKDPKNLILWGLWDMHFKDNVVAHLFVYKSAVHTTPRTAQGAGRLDRRVGDGSGTEVDNGVFISSGSSFLWRRRDRRTVVAPFSSYTISSDILPCGCPRKRVCHYL